MSYANELKNLIRKLERYPDSFLDDVRTALDELEHVVYHASINATSPNLEESLSRASDHIQKAEIAIRNLA